MSLFPAFPPISKTPLRSPRLCESTQSPAKPAVGKDSREFCKQAGKMTAPLDLLKFDETRERPWLTDKWGFVLGGVGGFGLACWMNFLKSRPLLSGLQRHIAYPMVGATLCYFLDRYRDKYLSERDAVLRHYIELHPEDFPTPERKKMSETFERWIPIR